MLERRQVKQVEEAQEVKEKSAHSASARVGPVRTFADLLVYQQACRLALEVSKVTRSFPRREQYELGRQVRRSSRSVAANIVEGWAKRNSAAEFKRHLVIAKGEAAETRFWLDLAADEAVADKAHCEKLNVEYSKLGMTVHNQWKEWRKI
jgi:four helix bundle protein